jgi:hypothetical protein
LPEEFPVQTGIDSVPGQQRFMRAPLDEPAMIEHQDEIGFANGAQTMGDDKSGPALEQ